MVTLASQRSLTAEPPKGVLAMFRRIGPGIIMSGSIVGSGELILTTRLGAEYGLVFLWAIIICCCIKCLIQIEVARYCILKGCTTIEALNQIPGPRFRGISWIVLLFFSGLLLLTVALAGILDAVGGLLGDLLPNLSIGTIQTSDVMNALIALLTAALLWTGSYRYLERTTSLLVVCFSVSVVGALLLAQFTPFALSSQELVKGLSLRIPEGSGFVALGLMGAIGITPTELFIYPYWALEEGYAKSVGPEETDKEDWRRRAKGWMRVLTVDALTGTFITTIVTVSYYLLGATILHRQGSLPAQENVVHDLAGVFTLSYGAWSYWLFIFGAFCTLYSTVVVFAASSGRIWTDFIAQLGLLKISSAQENVIWHRRIQNLFLCIQLIFSIITVKAVTMIRVGAFIDGLMLPLLAGSALILSRRVPASVRVGWLSYSLLALTSLVAILYVFVSALKLF